MMKSSQDPPHKRVSIVEPSQSDSEGDYQKKVFGDVKPPESSQSSGRFLNPHTSMDLRRKSQEDQLKIQIGRLDSDPSPSKLNHRSSTMQGRNMHRISNDKLGVGVTKSQFVKRKHQEISISKSSSESSSDSDSSLSSDYDDYLAKPNRYISRRKTKSFVFDFMLASMTERQHSLIPGGSSKNIPTSMNKSQNNLLEPGVLRSVSLLPQAGTRTYAPGYNKNDPEIYKSYVEQMKSFMNNVPENEKKLSQKSLKTIKEILKLETSWIFHFCGFCNFWLEYYVRIFFPI